MILQVPNPKLSKVCRDCTWDEAKKINRLLLDEIQKAEKSAKDYQVVGLAAPQVGYLWRAFTAFGHVFINPKLTWQSDDLIDAHEGCLSLPGKEFDKKRSQRIHVLWFNKKREFHKAYFKNSAAVVIQHELDHLEGKTIDANKNP